MKKDTWHKRLAHAMTTRNVKGAELARNTGNSPASISDWLSGKTKMMGGDNAVRACNYLKIEPAWLFFGQEPSGLSLTAEEPRLVYKNTTPESSKWPLDGISQKRWESLKTVQRKAIVDWVDDQITHYTGVENQRKRANN